MKRPPLREVPMPNPFPPPLGLLAVMGVRQWSAMLASVYNTGGLLVEMDKNGQFGRAFQKAPPRGAFKSTRGYMGDRGNTPHGPHD